MQYPDAAWMVTADIRAIGGLMKLAVWYGAIDESAATLSFDEFSKQFMAELDYVYALQLHAISTALSLTRRP